MSVENVNPVIQPHAKAPCQNSMVKFAIKCTHAMICTTVQRIANANSSRLTVLAFLSLFCFASFAQRMKLTIVIIQQTGCHL